MKALLEIFLNGGFRYDASDEQAVLSAGRGDPARRAAQR